ncbi:MAG TPA: glycine cleavage system protein H [Candidatus Dormibacteraeota bacterium]|nr:glycine cleavage system protein H [Candidatus Dormibacteraeota bacterium]
MSILFVLLTYLVVISVNYLWFRPPQTQAAAPGRSIAPPAPVMTRQYGFSIPQGYCFHPGHTWVTREGHDDVRVGIDSFTADLLGKIDRIDVVKPDRWIRQGQKFMTVHADGVSFELVSPVEGVVTAVNRDVVQDPTLAVRDPYHDGWIATVKAPDFSTNQRNLMQASMIAPWMHYSQTRLNAAVAKLNPALAQDGGVPVNGLLLRVSPELREKLITDFFLN